MVLALALLALALILALALMALALFGADFVWGGLSPVSPVLCI